MRVWYYEETDFAGIYQPKLMTSEIGRPQERPVGDGKSAIRIVVEIPVEWHDLPLDMIAERYGTKPPPPEQKPPAQPPVYCPHCARAGYSVIATSKDNFPLHLGRHIAFCPGCGASGGFYETEAEAVRNWERRTRP